MYLLQDLGVHKAKEPAHTDYETQYTVKNKRNKFTQMDPYNIKLKQSVIWCMDQMPSKRVFTKQSTSIFHSTITAVGALPKEIIEKVGIIMYICNSQGLSSLFNQIVKVSNCIAYFNYFSRSQVHKTQSFLISM